MNPEGPHKSTSRDRTQLAFVGQSFFLVFLQLELKSVDNNEGQVGLRTAAPTEGVPDA